MICDRCRKAEAVVFALHGLGYCEPCQEAIDKNRLTQNMVSMTWRSAP